MGLKNLAKLCAMHSNIHKYIFPVLLLLIAAIMIGCRQTADDAPPTVSPTSVPTATLPEMTMTVEMPTQVARGERYNVVVRVSNLSAETVENLLVILPLPADVVNVATPAGATVAGSTLTWTISKVQTGATVTELLTFEAPFEVQEVLLPAAQLQVAGESVATASAQSFAVAGGSLPVEIAREKLGETVSIAGVVTLYAGRIFYVADESGGVRVQVPADAPNLTFDVGQMVTVTGEVVSFDGSVAIMLDVETLAASLCSTCAPLDLPPVADDPALGQLTTLTGTVREIITLADGTQILLADDAGEVAQIWIDDRVGISAEMLTIGQQATVVGIYDDWQGNRAVAPRQQSDLAAIFPAALRLTFAAPASVAIAEPLTHTLTLYNDSAQPRSNIVVSAAVPRLADDLFAGTVITNSGNGRLGTDGIIYWGVPELPPQSAQTFSYQIQYFEPGTATTVMTVRAENSADEFNLQETIYVGQPVPIYAIQEGDSSPLRGREVLIEGIVTYVAPERGGFFVQQPSDILVRGVGVFVETIGDPTVTSGDAVQVRGTVRERNRETIVAELRGGIMVLSADNPLPQPLPLDPMGDSADIPAYMEPFEGMLVELNEPLQVVEATSPDGVTALVYERHGLETSAAGQIILVQGLADLQRGDLVEPLDGVVSAEFDRYIILKK